MIVILIEDCKESHHKLVYYATSEVPALSSTATFIQTSASTDHIKTMTCSALEATEAKEKMQRTSFGPMTYQELSLDLCHNSRHIRR
jgi:hypothetical protein